MAAVLRENEIELLRKMMRHWGANHPLLTEGASGPVGETGTTCSHCARTVNDSSYSMTLIGPLRGQGPSPPPGDDRRVFCDWFCFKVWIEGKLAWLT